MSAADEIARTPLIIENQWRLLEELIGEAISSEKEAILSRTIERTSRQLRKQLKTRLEPLELRSTARGSELRANGIAGTLSLGRLVVDVAPKFTQSDKAIESWTASTLLLLRNAQRRHIAYRRSQNLAVTRHSFMDQLALAYIDALEAGLNDQVIQTYKMRQERLPVLRGKLNSQRQLRGMLQRPQLLECDVDQMDTDNEYNALLKWATILLGSTVRSPSTRRFMQELVNRVPGVPSPQLAFRSARIYPPPQYRSWGDALDIAALLAMGLAHTAGFGQYKGYSFVFNMERLFEHFIERAVTRTLAIIDTRDLESRAQEVKAYAEPILRAKRYYYSRPDNVLLREKRTIAVVDAKYKRLSDAENKRLSKPNNADVYELVAAMTAHDCKAGLLIYPHIVGDTELPDGQVRSWRVNTFGVDLKVSAVALDLTELRTTDDLVKVDRRLAEVLIEAIPGLG
jgi:5-methylcytosine-specific restriction endonuclease McrBC regulatory subunit McrC